MHNLHTASAKHVAGAHQHRVTDKFGYLERFLDAGNPGAGRLWNTQIAQELFKTAAVFGKVDIFGASAQDRRAALR